MIDLVYFANPMCSWCWGFSPVMRRILDEHGDRVKFSLVTGSLGDRGRKPMDNEARTYVRGHWDHVQEMTGQPFDFAFFDRDHFMYDTEKPSRAVAVMRAAYPALVFPFFAHLQERFYAHNDDITDRSVLSRLAGHFGTERDAFEEGYDHPSTAQLLQREWQETASLGVNGYPTLLAVKDGKPSVLTIGYQSWDEIDKRFRELDAITTLA